MHFTLMPSLQERSLTAVAIALWNHHDPAVVLSPIFSISSSLLFSVPPRSHATICEKKWLDVLNTVLEKVRKLPVPETLKEELPKYVNAVGREILKMKEYLGDKRFTNFSKLCWTSQGTIDKKKTAELLIKEANLGVYGRYKLACINCLEDYIPPLWEQLEGFPKDLEYMKRHAPALLSFWSHYVKGEMAQLDVAVKVNQFLDPNITVNEYAFRYSAMTGKEAATEYFFRKLTSEEKERTLLKAAKDVASNRFLSVSNSNADFSPEENFTEVLCFLLSKMDKEKQTEMLKEIPLKVLDSFFDWPWQSLMVETVKSMSDFITEECFCDLLRKVVAKMLQQYKDWDYRKLFGELWLQIPLVHKKYFIGECVSNGSLLLDLIKLEDKENIRLILKYATAEEKEKILHSVCRRMFFKSIYQQFDTVKFFFKECIPSEDKMIEFRKKLVAFRWYPSNVNLEMASLIRDSCKVLNKIMNEICGKRSMEEDSASPAKRFHLA